MVPRLKWNSGVHVKPEFVEHPRSTKNCGRFCVFLCLPLSLQQIRRSNKCTPNARPYGVGDMGRYHLIFSEKFKNGFRGEGIDWVLLPLATCLIFQRFPRNYDTSFSCVTFVLIRPVLISVCSRRGFFGKKRFFRIRISIENVRCRFRLTRWRWCSSRFVFYYPIWALFE